jgi:hypothetical protein
VSGPVRVRRLGAAWTIAVAALVAAAGGTACHGTSRAFGPTLTTARDGADALFASLEERFTRVERSPVVTAALSTIARSALTPSRVYDDTAAWTAVGGDSVRVLTLAGHYVDDRYVVTEMPAAPAPSHLAAARDEIRLAQLPRHEFEWTTRVEEAIGSVTSDDVDRVVGAMLSAAATTSDDALRAGSVAAFPRTADVLGSLVSLDSVRTVRQDGGSTVVSLDMGLHSDGLRPTYPAFAHYLRKYVEPTHVHCVLRDPAGNEWLDVQLASNQLRVRLGATGDGHFAPLTGPPRSMPDSLVLSTDFRTKVWLFSLGMSGLAGDFIVIHTAHTRGWRFSFRREPQWHFPFAVDHLVRSSLRRPFAGDGAHYRVVVNDSTSGGTTWLERDAAITVQESTTLRWLGGLSTNALKEFSGPPEAQEGAFLATVFGALRDDVRADLAEDKGTP